MSEKMENMHSQEHKEGEAKKGYRMTLWSKKGSVEIPIVGNEGNILVPESDKDENIVRFRRVKEMPEGRPLGGEAIMLGEAIVGGHKVLLYRYPNAQENFQVAVDYSAAETEKQ